MHQKSSSITLGYDPTPWCVLEHEVVSIKLIEFRANVWNSMVLYFQFQWFYVYMTDFYERFYVWLKVHACKSLNLCKFIRTSLSCKKKIQGSFDEIQKW